MSTKFEKRQVNHVTTIPTLQVSVVVCLNQEHLSIHLCDVVSQRITRNSSCKWKGFTVDVYRKCVKLSHVLKSGQLFQQMLLAWSAAKHSQDDSVLRFPFVLELCTFERITQRVLQHPHTRYYIIFKMSNDCFVSQLNVI